MQRLTANFLMVAALSLTLLWPAWDVGAQQNSATLQLFEQVRDLQNRGEYLKALPIAERLLSLREAELDSEHVDIAAAAKVLASSYEQTGALDKAEPLYKRALSIREKILGPEATDTAVSLADLAAFYSRVGSGERAEALQQRALAICEKVLGTEHPLYSQYLSNLARMYDRMGLYTKSEPLHLRALALKEKVLGEHRLTAATLQNLGNLAVVKGDYAGAETLYKRSLAMKEKVLGPDHPETAEALQGLAIAYDRTGAYAKAVPLLERAISIRERAAGPESQAGAIMTGNLGLLYFSMGDYAKARVLYERWLALEEKLTGVDTPETALPLLSLGELKVATGAYQEAEPLLLRALKINEQSGQDSDAALVLDTLGVMYRFAGDYRRAESHLQRAVARHERIDGPEHPNTAEALMQFAQLHWDEGRLTQALRLLQRAHAVQARNTERFIVSGSESRNLNYLEKLADGVNLAASLSLAAPGPASAALAMQNILRYKGRALDAASDDVARLRSSVRASDRAVFDELTQVAQELSTLTYQGSAGLSPAAHTQRIKQLNQRQERLEAALAGNGGEFLRQSRSGSLAAVRKAIPDDAVLVEWQEFKPFQPKSTSKERQWGPPRYLVTVTRRAGSVITIDLGASEEIEALTAEFRAAVSSPDRSDVRQHAAALSKRVIFPLLPHIRGAHHLLLSPDGVLNLVPMAALLDADGRYLLERFDISHITSGRDLVRIFAAETLPSSNAVVFADPDYGPRVRIVQNSSSPASTERSEELDRGGLTFRRLPGTAQEAAAIGRLLAKESPRVLTAAEASEMNLKNLHGPRILHVATHGFFLRDQDITRAISSAAIKNASGIIENSLLRSGLALAGANQRRSGSSDDGILTALEASRLDLRGTELVVLSACETGIGETRSSVGVNGLRRALLLAGAQSQIASLWKVADLTTKELMVDFYGRLSRGVGRSAALRQSQRQMLQQPQSSHPYYWAAFVAIGDWRRLHSDAEL